MGFKKSFTFYNYNNFTPTGFNYIYNWFQKTLFTLMKRLKYDMYFLEPRRGDIFLTNVSANPTKTP